ncbi:MAG: hypothetical protein ABIG92_04535 [Candidatus Omnitrophota bacterium]
MGKYDAAREKLERKENAMTRVIGSELIYNPYPIIDERLFLIFIIVAGLLIAV